MKTLTTLLILYYVMCVVNVVKLSTELNIKSAMIVVLFVVIIAGLLSKNIKLKTVALLINSCYLILLGVVFYDGTNVLYLHIFLKISMKS